MKRKQDSNDKQKLSLPRDAPIPTLWLFGKTGSGKSSIIRFLTGATDAQIGNGFRPQTKFSGRFDFPDHEATIATFLDTRGIGESNYDPTADLAQFDDSANLMIVTVRALDQAVENVILPLRQLKKSNAQRPVLLVLTCLHDAYPGQQHGSDNEILKRSTDAQLERFAGLYDRLVRVDLTVPEAGFDEPNWGGQALREAILELLPAAYRQTLLQLDELNQTLTQEHNRRVGPVILAYSVMAATAAAVPLPWADIPLVLGIQSRLAYKIAKLNRQTIDTKTLTQVSAAMGGNLALRMGIRESLKFVPWIGIATNVASTFAFTFAAGWAWNWYFVQVAAGHLPTNDELKTVYKQQLKRGEDFWKASTEKNSN